METIEFAFVLHKIQNVKDGGFRVTLDLPSLYAMSAASLLVISDMPGLVGHARLEFPTEKLAEKDNGLGL